VHHGDLAVLDEAVAALVAMVGRILPERLTRAGLVLTECLVGVRLVVRVAGLRLAAECLEGTEHAAF
jgi:hypothetical protein